jgi:hypothetical protein
LPNEIEEPSVIPPAQSTQLPIRCEGKFYIHVWKHQDVVGYDYKVPASYEWRFDGTQWVAYHIDRKEVWEQHVLDVNQKIDIFNADMRKIFSAGSKIPIPFHNYINGIENEGDIKSSTPICFEESQPDRIEPFGSVFEANGYKTELRFGRQLEIAITSPGGSAVTYRLPVALFDSLANHGLGDGPDVPLPEPTYVTPFTETTSLEYINQTLGEMAHAAQNKLPSIEFVFAPGDTDGVYEIHKATAKALAVLASYSSGPVLASMHVVLNDNQKVITFVQQAGMQDTSIKMDRWWQQRPATNPPQFDINYTNLSQDIVQGKVFIYPQAR